MTLNIEKAEGVKKTKNCNAKPADAGNLGLVGTWGYERARARENEQGVSMNFLRYEYKMRRPSTYFYIARYGV